MPYIKISLSSLSGTANTAETRRLIEPVCANIREMSRTSFNLHPRSNYDKDALIRSLRKITVYAQQELDDEYAAYLFSPDTHAAAKSALKITSSILDAIYNQAILKNYVSHLTNILDCNCTPDHIRHILYSTLNLLLLVIEEAYCQTIYSASYHISIS